MLAQAPLGSEGRAMRAREPGGGLLCQPCRGEQPAEQPAAAAPPAAAAAAPQAEASALCALCGAPGKHSMFIVTPSQNGFLPDF